jgi:hypothetical protein
MVPVGYSAIGETIAKMGSRTVNDERIKGELRWQQSLTNKRTEQKEFVHSALQLLSFRAFVFMIQGSGFVKMGHSQSKFTSMLSTTDELNGKIFGFLGDRREHVDPKIMEIPEKYFGQWHTVKALTDPADMDTWYSGNISNRTTFWSGGTSKTNVTLPYILFLPTVAVKMLGLDRQSLTPFECYNIIRHHINGPDTKLSAADWTLVLSWFITANQGKSSTKESLLKIETLSVMNDDEEFKEWIDTRLVASLGQKPIPQAQVVHQQMQMMALTFSKDLGWELARGLKKAAPRLTKYNDETKKEVAKYSPDE